MSRAAQTFKQGDLVKAIKAAVKAGLPVARVEVSPEGRIIVIAGKPGQEQDDSQTPLDRWRRERGQN